MDNYARDSVTGITSISHMAGVIHLVEIQQLNFLPMFSNLLILNCILLPKRIDLMET